MIDISCEFSVPLGRFDLSAYIRELDISVYILDDNDQKIILGKIAADQLLLADAEVDGKRLLDICDEDSQGMYELYTALFENGSEFHSELGLDFPTEHILFLWRSTLHQKIFPYQEAILAVLSEMFGHDCVVIMWREVSQLTDKQLSGLGFSKIAEKEFVFRHVATYSDFRKANPKGIEVPFEFNATKEDEAWVMEQWNKDGTDLNDTETMPNE